MNGLCFATLWLMVVGAEACGRTQMDGPVPRSGGIAGNAGAGGLVSSGGVLGGAGGAGGSGGSEDCPPCLADALNACIPAGRCVMEMHGSGMGSATSMCFENGVQVFSGVGVSGNTVHTSGSAYQNGKTCYSWNRTTGPSESGTITFSDGDGNQLAAGSTDQTGANVVDCAGESYVMSPHCGRWDESHDCDAGNCP
jgi:hypothetical protein